MKTVAVHSRDPELLGRLDRLVPRDESLVVQTLDVGQDLLEFLLFQIPDLVILTLDPDVDDYKDLFSKLDADPWMSSISFLVVSPDVDRTIELYRSYGITSFLEQDGIDRELARAVRIILRGADPLRGASVLKALTALSGELVLPTDLFYAPYYAGFFSNFLYKEGYISPEKRFAVHLSLTELLVNAMEHGNAGISYEDKTAWLVNSRSVQLLVDQRMAAPPFAGRTVHLAYSIAPTRSSFTITDEGDGFDTAKILGASPKAGLFEAHGRGILMSRSSVDRLVYNEKGNSVTIEVEHDGSAERTIPPGFVDAAPLKFAPGEVVFREDDPADHLYYVVSGEYEVRIKGQRILAVGPPDIFIGEMSFLIGNRRTATVIATRPGQLVEISRALFAQAVKSHPSYGIFLCKLLARRLKDSNDRYAAVAPGNAGGLT